MNQNIFVAAFRSMFLREFQEEPIGNPDVLVCQSGLCLSFDLKVPIRDIDDDFVETWKLRWIEIIRDAKTKLPPLVYRNRFWTVSDQPVDFTAKVGTDAGTPMSDKYRLVSLWVDIQVWPLTAEEIARRAADVLWLPILGPSGGWHYPKAPEPATEPVTTEALVAMLSDGASLMPRLFNSEGGFSDN